MLEPIAAIVLMYAVVWRRASGRLASRRPCV